MKLNEVLTKYSKELKEIGIHSSNIDTELLLSKSLNLLKRENLLALENSTFELSGETLANFKNLISRRKKFEPTAYIIDKREFWDQDFSLNKSVLIPRPETEFLVEFFFKITRNKKSLNVLDIGTGSGCIILTILKHCLSARGYAIDISNQALKVAKKNAYKIGINQLRLKFSKTSFQKIANKKFDVIVSNPPYIPLHKIRGLSPEVRNYEPLIALNGGIDGLDVTKKIIYKSGEILKLNGILLIEIGYNQFKEISKTLKHKGYRIIRSIKDYSGHIRCIAAQKVR